MEESVDLRHQSRVSEERGDEEIVELDYFSTTAAAANDVTLDDLDVWDRMSSVDVSNGETEVAESTSADLEWLHRQFQVLLQDTVDGTFNVHSWERVFRAHDQRQRAECQVCLETVKLDKRACCGMAMCENCVRKHVETQLREVGVVRIGCPNPACGSLVFQEEIRELLKARPALRDRYDRWLVDFNADPRRKTCPRCCRITELMETVQPRDGGGRRTGGKYGVPVDCADCQLRWCFSCQTPWHDRLTCADNRAGDKLLEWWARQRTARRENNAQRCPKCKVRVPAICFTAPRLCIASAVQ